MPLISAARLCDLGYVAPRHIFEGTNLLENPANTAPIGTGPFKFVRYERGQYVIAERNPIIGARTFPISTGSSGASSPTRRRRPRRWRRERFSRRNTTRSRSPISTG
jgi:ABC-type transport system substrate-binding protein